MFDSVWAAIGTLATLAGVLAALAFIVGMILFWNHLPDDSLPGEAVEDVTPYGRHAK